DGLAFGMVADDAFAAVPFEGGFHFQLLSTADCSGLFCGEAAGEFASDSAGGFLAGAVAGGVVRSSHLSCPCGGFAGGRTRTRVLPRRDRLFDFCQTTFVRQRAPADFSFSRLSRTSLSGFWRLAPFRQT